LGLKQIFFSANSANTADGNERRIHSARRNFEEKIKVESGGEEEEKVSGKRPVEFNHK
jgi:hypothetical protein